MGRPTLTAGEIVRMRYASNLLSAYRTMKKSGDWVSFSNKEPYWAGELTRAAAMSKEIDG